MKKAKETGVGWVACYGKISTASTNSFSFYTSRGCKYAFQTIFSLLYQSSSTRDCCHTMYTVGFCYCCLNVLTNKAFNHFQYVTHRKAHKAKGCTNSARVVNNIWSLSSHKMPVIGKFSPQYYDVLKCAHIVSTLYKPSGRFSHVTVCRPNRRHQYELLKHLPFRASHG